MTDNYTNNEADRPEEYWAMMHALQWYIDNGVDEALLDEPIDRTAVPTLADAMNVVPKRPMPIAPTATGGDEGAMAPIGSAEAIVEARKLAAGCNSLDELKAAIQGFDGLSVKKTATNLVFSDGDPQSHVMLIGEAPDAEDDVAGKPFAGASGQLLDKIMASIGLSRNSETPEHGVYLTNMLNWRPPGNRTPTQSEMSISLAFIERHIALVQPKYIILCGGVAAKTLLGSSETISKLRGKFHDYDVSKDGAVKIPALTTYHPAYLLKTPAQKKAVWADMLLFKSKLAN